MTITIVQGNDHSLPFSDIHIVIDVIRAFTVAHYAFLNGAKKILLVQTAEEALKLKESHPDYLLMGEEHGIAIEGFDFDNSPKRLASANVRDKILVQKTTNGVKAALRSLNAGAVYVTGFSNAKTTARFIRNIYQNVEKELSIKIIASHPTGDDDLACAEYMKGIIEGTASPTALEVAERIKDSHVAEKFFDDHYPAFDREDILLCAKELNGHFVMKVHQTSPIPSIERVDL
jgi:2-phosphosulfolactate phosphatase